MVTEARQDFRKIRLIGRLNILFVNTAADHAMERDLYGHNINLNSYCYHVLLLELD